MSQLVSFLSNNTVTLSQEKNFVSCYIFLLFVKYSLLTAIFCFIATSASEEAPSSTLYISETQQEEGEGGEEEEEETEESSPVSGRGQRGVPRRAGRRARGRRGGATRARVVSTRIHRGRRNALVPSTLDSEDNNATLEETVNTETEESPKKPTTPVVEQKSNETKSITPTPADQTSLPSQTNSGSNVRVSGT
jgi:hypothetical protein